MTTSSSHSIPTPIFGMDITPTSDKESIGTYDSDFFKYPSLSPKLALLSHLAILLRDNIPRRKIVKNKFPYPHAFTGEDIVSTIQVQIQRKLLLLHGISTSDRRVALQIARSMQSQLFFCEVEWSDRPLRDSVEDVFMFLDDTKDTSDTYADDQLPTGVVPILATCYSPICTEGGSCYAIICPKHGDPDILEYSPLDSELVSERLVH
jgi:RHO1 GDP-GTP exchange protein 1/2